MLPATPSLCIHFPRKAKHSAALRQGEWSRCGGLCDARPIPRVFPRWAWRVVRRRDTHESPSGIHACHNAIPASRRIRQLRPKPCSLETGERELIIIFSCHESFAVCERIPPQLCSALSLFPGSRADA